jgi:hypothetical protein
VNVPLPWDRLLWTGRPRRPVWPPATGVRYILTDFRLIQIAGASTEIALHDIADVHRRVSRIDALFRTSTIDVQARGRAGARIVLRGVRRGAQLAALIELIAGDPHARLDSDAVGAALAWQPHRAAGSPRHAAAALLLVISAAIAAGIALHGSPGSAGHAANSVAGVDAPRSRVEMLRVMRDEVMPWARAALGPIVHGADRVRCETCHGADGERRDWRMPGVGVLPQPELVVSGWERYGRAMDAQLRNAIYGYLAESDKQPTAAYMREVVLPGMARLLGRPAYDFTRTYEYNRDRGAIGCYHCHRIR